MKVLSSSKYLTKILFPRFWITFMVGHNLWLIRGYFLFSVEIFNRPYSIIHKCFEINHFVLVPFDAFHMQAINILYILPAITNVDVVMTNAMFTASNMHVRDWIQQISITEIWMHFSLIWYCHSFFHQVLSQVIIYLGHQFQQAQ